MPASTKTLDDIKADMSALYDEVREGTVELKVASELANIAGKYLKAEATKLAWEVFLSGQSRLDIRHDDKALANQPS